MSSQDQVISETTLLLGNAPSNRRFRCSPDVLLIPVALATRLATLMPQTTLVELVRQAICRFWNLSHGDPATFSNSCDAPEVEQYFATVIAIIGAVEGIIGMAGCGVLSRISSRHGRKPALLLLVIAAIAGNCLIPMSQYMPDWLADWVSLLGLLFKFFSGPLLFDYIVNLYVIDISVPEERTASLSKIAGSSMLGTSISYALGGSITTKMGNPTVVFYVAAAISATTLIYVVLVLPESFSIEKRKDLIRIRQGSSSRASTTTSISSFLSIFEPLKMLTPSRGSNGTRNWRLTLCAAHYFLFSIANDYAITAWLILVTSKYHLTPADTGLFFSIVAASATFILTIIIPPLVHFLRPYYKRLNMRSPLMGDGTGNELEWDTSDRLNVHLSISGCVVAAVFYLAAAASTTTQALIVSGICIGFAFVHTPALRSLVAGSVEPLKQGEALAAILIFANAGSLLSPVIGGSILAATISTTPLLVFYVNSILFLFSGVLLLFVRDADRYQNLQDA